MGVYIKIFVQSVYMAGRIIGPKSREKPGMRQISVRDFEVLVDEKLRNGERYQGHVQTTVKGVLPMVVSIDPGEDLLYERERQGKPSIKAPLIAQISRIVKDKVVNTPAEELFYVSTQIIGDHYRIVSESNCSFTRGFAIVRRTNRTTEIYDGERKPVKEGARNEFVFDFNVKELEAIHRIEMVYLKDDSKNTGEVR